MNQVYVDAGLGIFLTRIVVSGFTFHLYTNNVTPTRNTVVSDLTEAAWAGYAAVSVPSGSFGAPTVAGHVGTIIGGPIAFANSSGGDVSAYGYFILDAVGSILLAAARFDSAPITKADGEFFTVIPIIGDSSKAGS